jgi:hypothetical protein
VAEIRSRSGAPRRGRLPIAGLRPALKPGHLLVYLALTVGALCR